MAKSKAKQVLDLTFVEPTLKAYGKAFDEYHLNHGKPPDLIYVPEYIHKTVFMTVFGPLEKWRNVKLYPHNKST